MHITQAPSPKIKVTVWVKTLSHCKTFQCCMFYMIKWILILLHTIIFHYKMMCHAHYPATYQGQGHSLSICKSSKSSCPGCIFHMLEWILILLHTIILLNKIMCPKMCIQYTMCCPRPVEDFCITCNTPFTCYIDFI